MRSRVAVGRSFFGAQKFRYSITMEINSTVEKIDNKIKFSKTKLFEKYTFAEKLKSAILASKSIVEKS